MSLSSVRQIEWWMLALTFFAHLHKNDGLLLSKLPLHQDRLNTHTSSLSIWAQGGNNIVHSWGAMPSNFLKIKFLSSYIHNIFTKIYKWFQILYISYMTFLKWLSFYICYYFSVYILEILVPSLFELVMASNSLYIMSSSFFFFLFLSIFWIRLEKLTQAITKTRKNFKCWL